MDHTGATEPTPPGKSDGSSHRLAVYGSLAPGCSNHGQLQGLSGRWIEGTVRGELHDGGWSAGLGYPGIRLDLEGPIVSVQVLISPDLPDHWRRLDEFEGSGYRREVTIVATAEGELAASIYVLADV
jgi:gamma-glutamylcyclotransferase (GGCT)/AIG2-like uncharacterized protein YtfP